MASELRVDFLKEEYPGKSVAEIASILASKYGYIAVIQFEGMGTYLACCRTIEELDEVLGSPYCKEKEVIYHVASLRDVFRSLQAQGVLKYSIPQSAPARKRDQVRKARSPKSGLALIIIGAILGIAGGIFGLILVLAHRADPVLSQNPAATVTTVLVCPTPIVVVGLLLLVAGFLIRRRARPSPPEKPPVLSQPSAQPPQPTPSPMAADRAGRPADGEVLEWIKARQWDKLSERGAPVVEPLIGVLKGADTATDQYDDMMVRSDAAQALGKIATQTDDQALRAHAVESLMAALGDPRWKVRYAATCAFAASGAQLKDTRLRETAVESLINVLHDEHKDVRANAAEALGNVAACLENEALCARTVTALSAILGDMNTYVRGVVARALANLGAPGVGALITALGDGRAYVRIDAVDGLGQVNDGQVVEPLAAALKGSTGDVRWHVVISLGEVGSHLGDAALRARVKEILTVALQDEDGLVREQADKQLQKLG